MSRSSMIKDAAFPPSERSMSCGGGGGDDGEAGAAAELTPNAPSPEGYNDPQPLLYGGGEEAAAIASRYAGWTQNFVYFCFAFVFVFDFVFVFVYFCFRFCVRFLFRFCFRF